MVLVIFRYGQWSANSRSPLALVARPMLRFLDLVVVRLLAGVELPFQVACGPGLSLQHGGRGVVVSAAARLGRDCTLFHNTTLARELNTDRAPVLGDRVVVGVGAVVLGGVRVGDDSVIGANAVVTKDVAPGSRVGGVPAAPLASGPAESGHRGIS